MQQGRIHEATEPRRHAIRHTDDSPPAGLDVKAAVPQQILETGSRQDGVQNITQRGVSGPAELGRAARRDEAAIAIIPPDTKSQ